MFSKEISIIRKCLCLLKAKKLIKDYKTNFPPLTEPNGILKILITDNASLQFDRLHRPILKSYFLQYESPINTEVFQTVSPV